MAITCEELRQATCACLVKAGSSYRPDRIAAYKRAIAEETLPNAKWFLEILLKNAEVADAEHLPLCDDTGIPHVIIRLGEDCPLPTGWLKAIRQGVSDGLNTLPGRPMAVKGDDIQRVEQSQGLFPNSDALEPAPFILRTVPGDKIEICVLMLGGGPEIRARTRRIFHKRSMAKVMGEVAEWLTDEVGKLGCTPVIAAVGIGRSNVEASATMLEAMADGTLDQQSEWEQWLTNELNKTDVGPLGLGGRHTVMGTFLKVGPTRASGVRVVCARPCCTMEPRVSKIVLG
ncbi:MAG: fumarate hydratase [Desulfovibrio sp.]|nr:fumarate hydratase [Desulfovibrio sp.]